MFSCLSFGKTIQLRFAFLSVNIALVVLCSSCKLNPDTEQRLPGLLYANDENRRAAKLFVFLLGRESIQHFEQFVPEENVSAIPGGHRWKTWRSLWQEILAASDGVLD
ncbi:hypothetical protein MLD52_01365 [Puniceicoccaceae bacterium K14]|nr:hypothetical protein [Puniceicoccaceae bacterium K14]